MEAAAVPRSVAACRAAPALPAARALALPRRALSVSIAAASTRRLHLTARRAADGEGAETAPEAGFLPSPASWTSTRSARSSPTVIEYKAGEYAVGIKNVTINDNFFPGHFPERPIMPGVLMVEAMAQVGGLVMLQPEVGGSRDNFFFAGIDKVRFRKPVIAGDTLIMRMTLTKYQKRFGLAKMEGKAYVGGDLVCEGEFLLVSATE
nr:unnamed protein product [Digitaria exilis]